MDSVAAEASHTLAQHEAGGYFKNAKMRVIPGAVHIPDPPPAVRDVPQDAPVRVGFIGMITPNKGVETLAEAAALLGENARFDYVIAGDGEPAFVESVLAKFPRTKTTYLGWTDADPFYRGIDVLVIPSIWAEPFGYVCIEALSHGVPVVVARSGALPEIIEPERSGLVFAPGDHEALASCLRRLEGDRELLRTMHHEALARSRRYTPDGLAAAWDAFLTQVTSRRRGFGGVLATKRGAGSTP